MSVTLFPSHSVFATVVCVLSVSNLKYNVLFLHIPFYLWWFWLVKQWNHFSGKHQSWKEHKKLIKKSCLPPSFFEKKDDKLTFLSRLMLNCCENGNSFVCAPFLPENFEPIETDLRETRTYCFWKWFGKIVVFYRSFFKPWYDFIADFKPGINKKVPVGWNK